MGRLRSLLPPPPPAVALARPPAPGEPAPALPGPLSGSAAVVAFLRHTGCPFAEATFRELRDRAEGEGGIAWIATSHSPEEETRAWAERLGGAGAVRLSADPDRSVYATWGLGRTGARHFMGGRSLAGVVRLARHGIRNTRADGSRWQRAGTFAITSDGRIAWRHLPEHAGDLPDLDAAEAAARGATTRAQAEA